MTLCDHVALIHEITRFHKIFMQSKIKPTPLPRKGKTQKPIKYVDESTSNSDSNDQAKTKTAKKTIKTEKVQNSMDTSNLSIKDYEPVTDWNSPENSPEIIPSSQIDIKVEIIPESPKTPVESEKPKNSKRIPEPIEMPPNTSAAQNTSATTCAPQLIHMTIEQLQQLIKVKQDEQKQKTLQEQSTVAFNISQTSDTSPHLSPLSNVFFKEDPRNAGATGFDTQRSPILPTGPPPKAPLDHQLTLNPGITRLYRLDHNGLQTLGNK